MLSKEQIKLFEKKVEKKKIIILKKLYLIIKKTEKWKLTMAIAHDKGSAYYDDMYEAVDCYLHLGFTPEEICDQINIGRR